MFKFFFLLFFIYANSVFAKTVELEVFANRSDISKEMSGFDLLTINGLRQAITSELEDQKLDSKLYWEKLDQKKMSAVEELQFLKPFFENVVVSEASPPDAKEVLKEEKLRGSLKADLNIEKLKTSYIEVTTNLAETKLKTFYILASIDIDPNMSWEDLGVAKAENFSGVVIDSWKKLIEKEFKGFEKVVVLDKDFPTKPDYMNSKSVTLKWNSTFRKVFSSAEKKTASYELSAQYVLVSSKSGDVITSFDFPLQKRGLDVQDKKALSSSLASLVYNLLLSQTNKLSSLLEVEAKAGEQSHLDIKIITKTSLSEIFAINTFLQEKFKDIKLVSQMQSYSADGAILSIRAEGSIDKILDSLSLEGGKYPLNEQKILLFNRTDKSFAILPKDSNNKN